LAALWCLLMMVLGMCQGLPVSLWIPPHRGKLRLREFQRLAQNHTTKISGSHRTLNLVSYVLFLLFC
jgi:hypothetical protein